MIQSDATSTYCLSHAQHTLYQELVLNLGSVRSQFQDLWRGMHWQPISATLSTQNYLNGC